MVPVAQSAATEHHMAKVRTVDTREMRPGRFRRETVPVPARPRLSAKLGELALAKQMARVEARRRGEEE